MTEDKSRRILFTGAAGGIGTMIRPLLARLYPGLVLSDKVKPANLLASETFVAADLSKPDEVAAAVKELSAKGKVVGASVDAGNPEALQAWVASSAEQLGGIDIYVHNTSGKPARSFEGWEKNFHVDMMSLIHGVDAATAALADQSEVRLFGGYTAGMFSVGLTVDQATLKPTTGDINNYIKTSGSRALALQTDPSNRIIIQKDFYKTNFLFGKLNSSNSVNPDFFSP